MPVVGPHRSGRASAKQPSPYALLLHAGNTSRVQSLMSDTASTVTTTSQMSMSEPGDPNERFTERPMGDGGHTRLVHKVKRRSNVPPSVNNQLSDNDKVNLLDAGHRLIVMLCSVDCWPQHRNKRPRPGLDSEISVMQMTAEVLIAVNASARREGREESPAAPTTNVVFSHQVSF